MAMLDFDALRVFLAGVLRQHPNKENQFGVGLLEPTLCIMLLLLPGLLHMVKRFTDSRQSQKSLECP